MASSPPLLDKFAASPCLEQVESLLLSRLPAEIRRQIYVEVWRTFGSDGGDDDGSGSLCPHIASTALPGIFDSSLMLSEARYFVAVPCLLPLPFLSRPAGHDKSGKGKSSSPKKNPYSIGEEGLEPRIFPPTRFIHLGPTGWTGHQICQRHSDWMPREAHLRPYLPLLMTCKRVYMEAISLLYSSLTFQFADAATAEVFLTRWPCVSSIRLYMRMTSTMLDVCHQSSYFVSAGVGTGTSLSRGDGPPCGLISGRPDEVSAPAWRRLCARIATLPRLRRLYVWAETGDLRDWHKMANEVRLFSGLFPPDAESASETTSSRETRLPPTVVLDLPSIPADSSARNLPTECYLHSAPPDASSRLPCIVNRTERPNNWVQFLSSMQQLVIPPRRRMSIASSGILIQPEPPFWP